MSSISNQNESITGVNCQSHSETPTGVNLDLSDFIRDFESVDSWDGVDSFIKDLFSEVNMEQSASSVSSTQVNQQISEPNPPKDYSPSSPCLPTLT
jgi:hypothetical protein